MTTHLVLDGPWHLLPVDAFRHGFYPLDDDAWVEQQVPAHWQQHPLFTRYAGKMAYRRRFRWPEPLPGGEQPARRYWLRINGAFYWSQPYFNGVDLGRHEGYFTPQEHEITPWLAEDNTLIIEVDCPEERRKFRKRLITGVFSHWDCIDPKSNPGGIWLPVEVIATGPVRIKEVLLDTQHASEAAAELHYRAVLDSAEALDVTLRWTIAPKNFPGEVQVIDERRSLAAGAHEVAGHLSIRDPQLWWTHDMGDPNCYTVTLSVLQGGAASDEHSFTFGIRHFTMREFIPYLNGVRFFAKGSNYAPTDARIATVTKERCAHDLELARRCHMNMLRVHAHVDHPALYEAADEAGILLWQDFPLQWLYDRAILGEAERQVRQMVRLLYNHPSIAVWCMHNEPIHIADTKDERIITGLRLYFSVFFWNWNRDVLDKRLKREAGRADKTRPVVRSSGEYSVPLLPKGTDTHFYSGWYIVYPPLHTWVSWMARFPKNMRFVTEFGAQSFPNVESCERFMDPDIAKIDWNRLVERNMFQANVMSHWLDWRSVPSLEALVQLTQGYQIAINRFFIDRLRYYKYRPTGGILPFMFHDPNPAILWSILDYWRVPKRSYAAMQRAFSPQYAFSLFDMTHYPIGKPIDVPVYVVNDAHREAPVQLHACLLDPNGERIASAERDLTLPADCMAIEAERLRLRPEKPGIYRLALALNGADGLALEQEYEIVVAEDTARPPKPPYWR